MARVLVIDDSATVREMARMALEPAGHEVLQAANGRVGLEVQRVLACDVVITDLIMPEKEGLETILELRREWPQLKIIAVSGGSAVLDKRDLLHAARSFGAGQTLSKPFTARQLIDSVSQAVSPPPA
ncbi:MAG: response regulator [Candidatus Binatia bacterium]|nr:response regulator [Candidatus Binatia bacterium]